MATACQLQVKTLSSDIVTLEIPTNTTIQELYDKVTPLEKGTKWKLMLGKTLKNLKLSEGGSTLEDFGIQSGESVRVEMILDMGACHTTCRR